MVLAEFERRVVANNIVRASDGLWNLTAFGKLFDKKFKDWFKSKHAKQFVEGVQASEPGREVLIVGISREPTWGHFKIASDMLYQSNIAYALCVTTLATRYVARDPTLATEVDRRVGVSNKRSHDEVYEAAPLSVLDSTAAQLVALAPDDKKIETYERLAKCAREHALKLVEAKQLLALREKDRIDSENGRLDREFAAYNKLDVDIKTGNLIVQHNERTEKHNLHVAEAHAKAAAENAEVERHKARNIEAHKATYLQRLEAAERERENIEAQDRIEDRVVKNRLDMSRMRKEFLADTAAAAAATEPSHPSSWAPTVRKV